MVVVVLVVLPVLRINNITGVGEDTSVEKRWTRARVWEVVVGVRSDAVRRRMRRCC